MASRISLAILFLFTGAVPVWGQSQAPAVQHVDTDGPGRVNAFTDTIVEVQGSNLENVTVQWQDQTVPSTTLSNGSLLFNVPSAPGPGFHHIDLLDAGGRRVQALNVLVMDDWTLETWTPPGPRLDDVTLFGFSLTGQQARMILLAHGANFPVNARIKVDGVMRATTFSRLLRNELHGMDPSTLGYPILHYATVWTTVTAPAGTTLTVEVCNDAGFQCSDPFRYTLPATLETLDSDGDGLFDAWECHPDDQQRDLEGRVNGCAQAVDLPLANRYRKDLFVQVDPMEEGGWSSAPHPLVFRAARQAFERAPVLNSDGSQGIALHIDSTHSVLFKEQICFEGRDCTAATDEHTATVESIKAATFNPRRESIYRYGIFGWRSVQNANRCTESGNSHAAAGNFYVTLGFSPHGNRADFQTGTFLHELGHVLGLRHGGADNALSKDNYNSLMHYGLADEFSEVKGLTTKPSPSQWSGIDLDCNLNAATRIYTYSQGMRRVLDENDLDETRGVCNHVALNWDDDVGTDRSGIARNLDTNDALTTITDHADWVTILETLREATPSTEPAVAPDPVDANADAPPDPASPSTLLTLPDPVPPDLTPNYFSLPDDIELGIALDFGGRLLCRKDASFEAEILAADATTITLRPLEPVEYGIGAGTCEQIDPKDIEQIATLLFRLPDGITFTPPAPGDYRFTYNVHAFGSALGFDMSITKPDGTPVLALGRIFKEQPQRDVVLMPGRRLEQVPTPNSTVLPVRLTDGATTLQDDINERELHTFSDDVGNRYDLLVLTSRGVNPSVCSTSRFGLEYVLVGK